ncbi:sensor histidine kinase [Petrocella sp. FN5]|uniref:sensor histidine kinase n=1 Tax=Petrocella sp. FN5 TaxID=3032002 RepID=UPI0023DB3D21|nr:HAMP domain-containing sensor histidine kinase [Petrocella sp. FN5]MDF1617187.1 HAMP domain-containing sensor histidine kinase [Petrocella sp. FN5]
MAIKLKKLLRHVLTKAVVLLVMVGAVFLATWGFYHIAIMQDAYQSEHFYETQEFENNLTRLAHNIVEKELILTDEASILALEISEEEKSEKVRRLRRIEQNLKQASDLDYMLVSKTTQRVISNVPKTEQGSILSRAVYVKWDYASIESSFNQSFGQNYYSYSTNEDIQRLLGLSQHELVVALKPELDPLSTYFGAPYKAFTDFKRHQNEYSLGLIIGLLIILSGTIYFTIFVGDEDGRKRPYDHVPFEIQVILAGVSIIPVYVIGESMHALNQFMDLIPILVALEISLLFWFFCYLSTVRRIKRGGFFKELLISQLLMKLIGAMTFDKSKGRLKPWLLLLIVAYGGMNMFFLLLFLLGLNRGITILLALPFFIAFNVIVLIVVNERIRTLNLMMHATKARVHGQINYPLETKKLTREFRQWGEELNQQQIGMEKALEEAMKGERMKTELITNVTHDLKNPLTSIINYVDLLKNEAINEEERKNYLQILEDKSLRLKSLIEQLVEASKASSGNVEVALETLDPYVLLQQVIGEYEEAFGEKNLIMMMNEPVPPFSIKGDGRLIHRIMDNLMANVAKYALDDTRVYISFIKEENLSQLAIEIKNISKEALNMAPELLTERFVRGDKSRHTEGNGLGLSIARSLSEAMGASLDIGIDGDLFKARLTFPLVILNAPLEQE